MKKFFLLFVLIFSISLSFPQDNPNPTNTPGTQQTQPKKKKAVVGKRAHVNMYHNYHDLEKLRKRSLKSIYIRRALAIYEILPFLPLNAKQGATVDELGIPRTKKNIKRLKKDHKRKLKYVNRLKKHMNEVLEYASRPRLIEGILLMENMLGHVHQMRIDMDQRIKD